MKKMVLLAVLATSLNTLALTPSEEKACLAKFAKLKEQNAESVQFATQDLSDARKVGTAQEVADAAYYLNVVLLEQRQLHELRTENPSNSDFCAKLNEQY